LYVRSPIASALKALVRAMMRGKGLVRSTGAAAPGADGRFEFQDNIDLPVSKQQWIDV